MPAALSGIGVDIISLRRAGQFLQAHRKTISERFCHPSEKKFFSRKNISKLLFSKLFTAKEAFFKALGGSWMGIEGFRKLKVKILPHDLFWVSSEEAGREARGVFFRDQNFVGAQVILWTGDK